MGEGENFEGGGGAGARRVYKEESGVSEVFAYESEGEEGGVDGCMYVGSCWVFWNVGYAF